MRNLFLLLACTTLWCLAAASAAGIAVVRLDDGWTGCAERQDTSTPAWARALPDATSVVLPHGWTDDPRAADACAFWYARDVTFPPDVDGRGAWLLLEDVAGDLEVYLDGAPAASLHGCGLPQRIALRGGPGVHHLALRLVRPERGVGIGLGVPALQPIGPASLDVLLPEGEAEGGRVSVRYRVLAEAPVQGTLLLELYAPDRKHAIAKTAIPLDLPAGGTTGTAEWRHLAGLRSWTPDAPRLYRVRAALLAGGTGADAREVAFGLTRYALGDDGLLLCGKRLPLRGLRLPGGLGVGLTGDVARALQPVRNAGFTALLAEDLAFPRAVLDTADRLGMLVLVEMPAGADPARLVTALGAHPSVVGWMWAGDGDVSAVRTWDTARPVLTRAGAGDTLFLPQGDPHGVALADGDPTTWRDPGATPVFAPCIAPAIPANCPLGAMVCGDGRMAYTGEDRELVAMRATVELMRRAECPLGYFVRPFPGEAGTGLATAGGAPTKFGTVVRAANAPILMTLRPDGETFLGQALAIDAALVNESERQQELVLYRVVTTPEPGGQTTIARREAFALTGGRVQAIPRTSFPLLSADRPGLYRVQYVLAERGRVLTSSNIAIAVRGEGQP